MKKTINGLTRFEAAYRCRAKLGGGHNWHETLRDWSRKKAAGLPRSGLCLLPSGQAGRWPLYAVEEVEQFIELVRDAHPDMHPDAHTEPATYQEDDDGLICPGEPDWRTVKLKLVKE